MPQRDAFDARPPNPRHANPRSAPSAVVYFVIHRPTKSPGSEGSETSRKCPRGAGRLASNKAATNRSTAFGSRETGSTRVKRISIRQLLITFVPAVLILAAILVMRMRYGLTTSAMTEDVASTAGVYPLTGFLSNLGVLLWCATAAVCFFAATLLRRTEARETYQFLLWSAVLSAYLCFDDLFVIHDDLAARWFGSSESVGEAIVFVSLGVAVVAYLIAFRKVMWRTDCSLLLLAMGFFAVSLLLDEFVTHTGSPYRGAYFLEDGSKWLGIASWFSYFVRTSYQLATGTSERTTPRDSYV